jgi:hypothetical protein
MDMHGNHHSHTVKHMPVTECMTREHLYCTMDDNVTSRSKDPRHPLIRACHVVPSTTYHFRNYNCADRNDFLKVTAPDAASHHQTVAAATQGPTS